ncbi:MAG: hypothetical protein H6586_10080 [Flavobacteriales bacterium]|nr:hypothetical protein [Flavobacteriales bacterium]
MENLFQLNWNNNQLFYEKPLIYSYNFSSLWKSILVTFAFIFGVAFLVGKFTSFEIGNIFFVVINFMWCFMVVSMGGFQKWNFQYKFREDKDVGGYLLSVYKNYGRFDIKQEKELRMYSAFTMVLFIALSSILLITLFELLYAESGRSQMAISFVFVFLIYSSIHLLYKIYYFETREFIYDHLFWDRLPESSKTFKNITENRIIKIILNPIRIIITIILVVLLIYGFFYMILLLPNFWTTNEYTVNDFWISRKITEGLTMFYQYFLGTIGFSHEQFIQGCSVIIGLMALAYFFISLFHFFFYSISTKELLLEKRFLPTLTPENDQESLIPSIEPFHTPSSDNKRTTPSENLELKKLKYRIARELIEFDKLNDDEIVRACFISKKELIEIRENTAANKA